MFFGYLRFQPEYCLQRDEIMVLWDIKSASVFQSSVYEESCRTEVIFTVDRMECRIRQVCCFFQQVVSVRCHGNKHNILGRYENKGVKARGL